MVTIWSSDHNAFWTWNEFLVVSAENGRNVASYRLHMNPNLDTTIFSEMVGARYVVVSLTKVSPFLGKLRSGRVLGDRMHELCFQNVLILLIWNVSARTRCIYRIMRKKSSVGKNQGKIVSSFLKAESDHASVPFCTHIMARGVEISAFSWCSKNGPMIPAQGVEVAMILKSSHTNEVQNQSY